MPGMELEGLDDFREATAEMAADVTTDDYTRVVGTNVEYAPHTEYGTAPHTITGDPLAFPGDNGETVFATSVDHPGTPAQPHVRPGIAATEEQLAEIAVTADSLDDFLDRAALTAVREIQRRTPVDSGTLRASYRIL